MKMPRNNIDALWEAEDYCEGQMRKNMFEKKN